MGQVMNLPQLLALKKLVGDMRFIQAAAMVASNLNDNKIALRYMDDLHLLDDAIETEIRMENRHA